MYVGVILRLMKHLAANHRIPHVRGGDPINYCPMCGRPLVFPMYVGVILQHLASTANMARIPHVRGGDPDKPKKEAMAMTYSPCTWG